MYRSFLQDEFEKDYDGSAYTSTFLPKLPREHGSLLAVCLELIAAIATHDTQNAMPGEPYAPLSHLSLRSYGN